MTIGFAGRVLIVCAVVVGALLLVWSLPHGSDHTGVDTPSVGTLAPAHADMLAAPRLLAAVPAGQLGEGPVRDVALWRDTLYLLQRHQWMAVSADGTTSVFGSDIDGSPGWIAGASQIVVNDAGVFVLDEARYRVMRWNRDGTTGGHIDFRDPVSPFAITTGDLAVGPDGRVYLAVMRSGLSSVPEWFVLRFDAGNDADTLRTPPEAGFAVAFDAPRLALDSRRLHIVGAASAGYKRVPVEGVADGSNGFSSGAAFRVPAREDAPRWTFPDSIRRHYGQMLVTISPSLREDYELPEHVPPVFRIALADGGGLLVLLDTGRDYFHVELWDSMGIPVSHLTPTPLPAPVFLGPGSIYTVTESLDGTRIHQLRLRGEEDEWPAS